MNVFVMNTKEDILKNVGKQSSIVFPTMEVNDAPKHPDYKLLQNIFLCVHNKHIHTGLELLLSK